MSQKKHNDQKKSKQPLVYNNTSKKTEKKKSKESSQPGGTSKQTNRNSKSNALAMGDMKKQISIEQVIGAGTCNSPPMGLSSSADSNEKFEMQLAIQQSLQSSNNNNNINDELEDEFYDITSSDCDEDGDDIENWELMDESSSSLVNLNKPYSFSDIEFPVLRGESCVISNPISSSATTQSNKNNRPQSTPTNNLENPWLNPKGIKSITQQS